MSRYKSKSVWNYRMATKMDSNLQIRIFGIIEVYYTSIKDSNKNRPDSYIDYMDPCKNPLFGWESAKDLKKTIKYIKKASKKKIIYDLDHWPKKYIPGSDIQVTNDLYS